MCLYFTTKLMSLQQAEQGQRKYVVLISVLTAAAGATYAILIVECYPAKTKPSSLHAL